MKNVVINLPKSKTMKNLLFFTFTFLFLLLSNIQSIAQQGVSINNRGVAPDSNAILDVSSTTKGALFPRMTTAQRTAIERPAIGLTVFDLDKKTYWYYTGMEWVEMTTNKVEGTSEGNSNSRVNDDWNTLGNTNSGGEFLGTTNNQPLIFKTNDSERMRVAGNGNVGIGVQNPNERLEVGGSGRAFFGDGAGNNRTGLLIDGVEPNNGSRIEAFNYAGAGSGRNLSINPSGGGNVGIGVPNPIERLEVGGTGRAFFGDGQVNTRTGLLIDGVEPDNASRIEAFNYAGAGSGRNLIINTVGGGNVGIGITTPAQKLHVNGNAVVSGKLGIGISNPHAPLQFNDAFANRKLVLSENMNNDHSFYGFGTELFALRYQVAAPAANHIFYAATSDTSSQELMRITGSGRVGIGTKEPFENLEVGGNGRAFFGDGASENRSGLLIDGVEPNNATRIEAFNYAGAGSGRNLIINTSGGGFVGINNSDPHAPLQFSNDAASRKIVLYEDADNDNQFIGFGIDPGVLRYNVSNSQVSHVFYSGSSDSTSKELMRIQGDGNVGIGTSYPAAKLHVNGNMYVSENVQVAGGMGIIGNADVEGSLAIGYHQPDPVSVSISPNTYGQVTCSCPEGSVVLSGGFYWNSNDGEVRRSYPSSASSWTAGVFNEGDNSNTLYVYVICARLAN